MNFKPIECETCQGTGLVPFPEMGEKCFTICKECDGDGMVHIKGRFFHGRRKRHDCQSIRIGTSKLGRTITPKQFEVEFPKKAWGEPI